jgi:hypothetical protein
MAARSAHEAESSRCAGRDSSASIACSPLSSAVLLPSRRRCATGGARRRIEQLDPLVLR